MATDTPDFVDPAEDCPWRPPREIFAHYGYAPFAPCELDDRQLPGRLWEWLYAAANIEFPGSDSSDPVLEAQLRASEPDNWTPPAQELAKESVSLLPPAEITEDTLAPILWELLHNLALRGFYVLHTDHFSDGELYNGHWQHGLREPAHLPGRSPRGGWFHDFLGSWGEDDMRLWLGYYASRSEEH